MYFEGERMMDAHIKSTGDPDKFLFEKQINLNYIHKEIITYEDAASTMCSMYANGYKIKSNLMFKGGLEEAIQIANSRVKKPEDVLEENVTIV